MKGARILIPDAPLLLLMVVNPSPGLRFLHGRMQLFPFLPLNSI
jgi:hypothetical protein